MTPEAAGPEPATVAVYGRRHPFTTKDGIAKRTDHHATPPWLLELLFPDGRYFDPCPLAGSIDTHAGGGLDSEWPTDVPVFINPPYSDVTPWIQRAASHGGPIVLLLRADPAVGWWSYAHTGGFRVTFIGQRLRFGNSRIPASFPSAIWRRGW